MAPAMEAKAESTSSKVIESVSLPIN